MNARQEEIERLAREMQWEAAADTARRGPDNVDFDAVNRAALTYLPSLVHIWAPDGKMCGHEWQALNPTRPDKTPGSFSVNTRTGKWADFATGDKGGDPVSLAAYLFGTSQSNAARALAAALSVDWRARP